MSGGIGLSDGNDKELCNDGMGQKHGEALECVNEAMGGCGGVIFYVTGDVIRVPKTFEK
jgi:hypothetical protein